MQSMTMRNILSGFCVTGICPLDCTKLTGKNETREQMEKILFNPKISHLPFPVRKRQMASKKGKWPACGHATYFLVYTSS